MISENGSPLMKKKVNHPLRNLMVITLLLPSVMTATARAETLKDLKQKTVGFMAQTLCTTKRYDYDRDTVMRKISIYAEIKGERVYQIIEDPKVMQAANLMSLAMSKNCTSIDENSPYLRRAYEYMDANGI